MVKVKPVQNGRTTRMSFSHINEVIGMPNLIEIQKNSYNWFLEEGLHEVFHDIAAIEDYTGNLVLEFVDYRLDKNPKYSIKECKERDATYAAPLYVTARLFNKQTGEVKEQEIFMGDFPLMTDAGTFISNGAERAIVSQLVRSPGVFYGSSKDRTGKDLFTATMNPNRGAWLEYETDSSDVYYVRIDKNRKLPVTTLLRALGLSTDEQIKQFFGDSEPKINASLEKDITHNTEEGLLEVYRKLRPGEPPTVENSRAHLNNLFFDPRRYDLARFGRYKMNNKLSLTRRIAGYKAAEDIIAPLTGELLAAKGEKINMAKAEEIDNAGVTRVTILVEKKGEEPRPFIVISNGCVNAQNFFSFDVEAEAGVNERANFAEIRKILDTTSDVEEQKELLRQNHDVLISRTVTVDDIFASVNYLLGLDHGIGTTDEIDHLGNRRVRSVGELLQNQFRIGFSRMERVIRERMTLQNQENGEITPQSLVNIRPVVAAIKEFIGSSPLSQFMDQNNPLAELTHKRRLSALGPGGLSRDRAGFEVRDVHYTHYGRLCPIETPEGPNIGLISYLATYAKINKYGFVEAPYRKVDKATGTVTDEVVYMTADEEDEYIVAQANEPLDENNHFVRPRVSGRHRNDIQEFDASQVDYMDVSPRMMVSVATACIPFLENDDCNRALMGSNMQRQAVPKMLDILQAIALESKMDDLERFRELVSELKTDWDDNFFNRGQTVAITRLFSYCSAGARVNEQDEFSYYQFLKKLTDNFDELAPQVLEQLRLLIKRFFQKNRFLLSYSCDVKEQATVRQQCLDFISKLSEAEAGEKAEVLPVGTVNEAIATAGKVQYVAAGGNFAKHGHKYVGAMAVLETILSYEYLWTKIRIQGGAYGVTARFELNGVGVFASYRDPQLPKTLEAYQGLAEWLRNEEFPERELNKYVIGTISTMDKPLTNSMRLDKATAQYLKHVPVELRQRIRSEILNVSNADLQALAKVVEDMLSDGLICVVGGKQPIEANKSLFNNIINA